jgi:transcriptional regulator with XRE-family HTH domain
MKINADELRRLRAKMNISQEQLSEAAGLNPRTVQRIESTGKASIDSVNALAAALDLDPAELIVIDTGEADETDATTTPLDAIKDAFLNYADFTGTATRYEFWWFALFVVLVAGGLAYLSEAVSSVFLVAVLVPLLAVGARRLNDIGKNGWWLLYGLIPVGGIIMLGILWAMPPVEKQPAPQPG